MKLRCVNTIIHLQNVKMCCLLHIMLQKVINTHKKPYITPRHIQTTRLLCECELFAPQIYDNDPEMKRVMQQFHDRTTQRFQEYDERLQEKRRICKDTCDKEIQKIILRDKIEKELTEKFSSLHTDIQSDNIPTCICEKSLADKVEKGCLRCGSILGAAMPEVGSISATALYTLCQWQTKAIAAATKAAMVEGAAQGATAGIQAGKNLVIEVLKSFSVNDVCPEIFKSILKISHYNEVTKFASSINIQYRATCTSLKNDFVPPLGCKKFEIKFGIFLENGNKGPPSNYTIPKVLEQLAEKAKTTAKGFAETESTKVAAEIAQQQTAVINATYSSWQIAITASVIAIVVIVLIMVIIYLILRYRRKKKMKKKLQYIKLLEE
ncbi:hypothetical protein PFNF135_01341 [Plasmodium falciparum NF135/5.C10]|uniref:Surface antigen n=1 Tax=Plasmodium falciparum NF135/5.C10 TaxID=1036726 RepID=W4IMR8_PLAFA|nr:hypothetical protein PFNF135_01341 [Plasmodium falciparum NF135/5.C10]